MPWDKHLWYKNKSDSSLKTVRSGVFESNASKKFVLMLNNPSVKTPFSNFKKMILNGSKSFCPSCLEGKWNLDVYNRPITTKLSVPKLILLAAVLIKLETSVQGAGASTAYNNSYLQTNPITFPLQKEVSSFLSVNIQINPLSANFTHPWWP